MIKSLFEQDENQPDEINLEMKQTPESAVEKEAVEPEFSEVSELENQLEISDATADAANETEKPKSAFEKTFAELLAESSSEPVIIPESHSDLSENSTAETLEETSDLQLPDDLINEAADFQSPIEIADETPKFELPVEAKIEETKNPSDDLLFQSAAPRESFAETARNSGLAYAAAITLFGAVVFMLIIGWFVDLLLGSSPWGIVGGIVLGAAIGFFQFFRLTAQIFKNKE